MGTPKRHHYLPRFYLEKFCRDGLLWLYDTEESEFRRQTPKNTAVEKDYYTVLDKKGTKNTELETRLSEIESYAKLVIEKIENRQNISDEDKGILSLFISVLRVRVPDYQKVVDDLLEKLIDTVMQVSFSSESAARNIIEKYENETGEKLAANPKEFVDFVRERRYKLKIEKKFSLWGRFSPIIDLVFFFIQMNWVFLCVRDETSFITSDNPFFLVPPKDYDVSSSYGVGIITSGAKKIVPLTQKTCLMMLDHGNYIRYLDASKTEIRNINLAVTSNCDRFVIGRDEALVRSLVKATGLHERND